LSEEEITHYYELANIAGVEGDRASVTVYFAKYSNRFYDGGSGELIVELFDSTDPGWDLRCH
jgi:hypothetical protein